jgi:hypothetical protein
VAAFAVVVAVVSFVAAWELSCVLSSVDSAAVVTVLGDDVVKADVFAFRAVVFDAVITVSTAAIFASKLNVFSCRFFFWECFPCPGPGIAE